MRYNLTAAVKLHLNFYIKKQNKKYSSVVRDGGKNSSKLVFASCVWTLYFLQATCEMDICKLRVKRIFDKLRVNLWMLSEDRPGVPAVAVSFDCCCWLLLLVRQSVPTTRHDELREVVATLLSVVASTPAAADGGDLPHAVCSRGRGRHTPVDLPGTAYIHGDRQTDRELARALMGNHVYPRQNLTRLTDSTRSRCMLA